MRHQIFFLLCLLLGTTSFAQSYSNIEFIENKGQWDPEVKYMGQVPAGAFFIHKDGFTVVQHDPNQWGKIHDLKRQRATAKVENVDVVLRSHAYRMKFVNGNPSPKIVADKPLYTYNNYFIGDDPSKWASNCRVYQGITLKDVYPNVDARYYTDGGALKYDLIVNPGADIKKIALEYTGANGLQVKSKQLVIQTSVGDLKELEPYSYQYNQAGRNDVLVKYSLQGNIVRFDAKDYDPKSTLIIDPQLVFCSFTGSTADNWGFTATYGPDGSMFGGGIVFGNGFPVSPGAYQTVFGSGTSCPNSLPGPFDIGIMKLTPDGSQRVYATYLGGSGEDFPQSLIVDGQGNLIVAGRTDSPNYPTIGNVSKKGGLYDIIVTKLNAAGTALIGSVQWGGEADDGANISPCGGKENSLQQNYGDEARSEVNLDAAGNIYLASCTRSTKFPVQNAFQSTIGGQQDGVVMKFNPNLSSVLFSSYFGGANNDAAYVVSLHPTSDEIYIGGGTESNNLPGPAAGTVGASNHGSADGFVAIIANDGSSVIKTTYLGTSDIDQVYGVQFDLSGFPYAMGQTRGSWPVKAPWSQGGGKQFIVKLEKDLSAYVYSTVFGSGGPYPNISPVAFLVDRCENVYISGWGGGNTGYPSSGTSGLTVTPDAFQPNTDGGDFYFFVLKKDATAQLFGSFWGKVGGFPDHVDGGTSRFDKNGVIYQAICADCKGSGGGTFPTTAGAWRTFNPSDNCNLAMLKINLDLSGARGQVEAYIKGVKRSSGCIPLTVDFTDSIQTAQSYIWNFGDGTPNSPESTSPIISHTYQNAGTYTVTLIAIDPTKCIPRDTTYTIVKAIPDRMDLDFNTNKLSPCESFSYSFENLSKPLAGVSTNTNGFIWDFGDGTIQSGGMSPVVHSYKSPGTYKVKLILVDPFYCNSPDTLVKDLKVAAVVTADFETPAIGCAPYAAVFSNTSTGGVQFHWDFGDGSTSDLKVPTHTYNSPGVYTITLTATDDNTCNKTDTKQFTINIYSKPTAAFTHSTPGLNTPVTFTNASPPGAVRYRWDFGDGDSLITTSTADVQHEYNKTGTYQPCLTAYNQYGCVDKVCSSLSVTVEPAVDVPTAFTPTSGDVNSKIFVKGYGISKMRFTIWNRWGQKVFETDDKRVGWDGTFQGKLLPMDAYAYTLDVEFFDGTKARKKGDITLIR